MSESIRILFVDDEQKVLDGLRRMLYCMKKQWKMSFANGGKAALAELAANPYDIVVSDMRMPGMMGVELLRLVRENYPHIIRMALSGQASTDVVLESTGPTHQYLVKPCNLQILQKTVSDLIWLNDILPSDRLKSIAAGAVSLPSWPDNLNRLKKWAETEGKLDTLLEIVTCDVAMSAKVMQMVSSAFFGQVSDFLGLADAISYLGADNMRDLVSSVGIFTVSKSPEDAATVQRICQHSCRVAEMTRTIMQLESADKKSVQMAYLAGLLHDVGKLLLNELPESHAKIADQVSCGILQQNAEKEIFGVGHAEVGAYMLGIWGIDQRVVSAVAHHHCPCKAELDAKDYLIMCSVHVADAMIHSHESGVELDIDRDCIGRLGFADRLDEWLHARVCQS